MPDSFDTFWSFFYAELFTLGNSKVTVATVVYILVFTFLLIYLSGKFKLFLINRVLLKRSMDIGVRQAIGSISRYIIVIIGLMVLFESVGINLSALMIVIGALGVGIGIGLQNITNSFVSGIIMLFERPIKVGDRIQVGDITGDVMKISPRATRVRTNDNIAVIIPNSDFMSSQVINWSHSDRMIRVHVPVGVSYSEDPENIRKTLLQVADSQPGVLKDPKPDIIFQEFADSSLNFDLRVWTEDYITTPHVLRSNLNFEIKKIFNERGIEIPFPQRDLHVRSGVVKIAESARGTE